MSFTLASLYAPLILIFILYLPTIFYLSFLSAKFYGLKNCVRGFLDDPIYYVFPFFTNISFFQQNEKSLRKKSVEEEGEGSMESSLLWKGLVETTTGVIMLKNISQNQSESGKSYMFYCERELFPNPPKMMLKLMKMLTN